MSSVAPRALRSAVASLLGAGIGLAAVWVAEPLGDFLHRALGQFNQPQELVAWCAILALCAAFLVLARTRAPPGSSAIEGATDAVESWLRARGQQLASLPAGVTLPLIVAGSFATRTALNWDTTTPRVFGDELLYSGLAKSLAAGLGFDIRGLPAGLDYGLYPLVISVFYEQASDGVSAFLAVQTFNALAMSLAAVPSFYLARRILSPGWSLFVATLSIATPAMAYSALVMTEALFYPIFVTATLALVLALERPTHGRQAIAVALIVVAAAVRVQALVLVPALLTAVAIESVRPRRQVVATVRSFATAWSLLALLGAVAVLVWQGDVRAPLGAYGTLIREYAVQDVAKWLGWNLAALELSLGIVAFAALPVALRLLLRRSASQAQGAFAAVTIGVTVWTTLSVAMLSASPYGLERLHWRNLFVLIPPVLTCFAWWLAAGLPRSRRVTLAAAGVVLVLPLLVPARLVVGYYDVDSPSTRPWGKLMELTPSLDAWIVVAPFVALGVTTFLFARRPAFPIISVVFAFVAISGTTDLRVKLEREETERLAWVDGALADREHAFLVDVDLSGAGCARQATDPAQLVLNWMTEFFNTSVVGRGHVRGLGDALPSPALRIDDRGFVVDGQRAVRGEWAIVDSRVGLVGSPVARLAAGEIPGPWPSSVTSSLTLWRTDGLLRLSNRAQRRCLRAQ